MESQRTEKESSPTPPKSLAEIMQITGEHFWKVFRSAPNMMSLVTVQDAIIVEINDAFEQLLGYTRPELIGRSATGMGLWSFPKDREKHLATLRQSGKLREVETKARAKNGGEKIVLYSAEIIDIGGEKYVLSSGNDITDRKHTEEALQHRIEFEQLVVALSASLVGIDTNEADVAIRQSLVSVGEIMQVDRCYIYRCQSAREKCGKIHEWNLKSGGHRGSGEDVCSASHMGPLCSLVQQGRVVSVPDYSNLPDEALRQSCGKIAPQAKASIFVPLTIGDSVLGFLGIDSIETPRKWDDNDVTMLKTLAQVLASAIYYKRADDERLEFEQQMQHAQKLESLGVLAGGIAHDFNNLLMAILGNAELALSALSADPAVVQSSLRDIVVASQSAADLARQMLDYSGKGQMTTSFVDLSDLVGQMVQLLKATVPKKIELDIRLGDQLPPLRADLSQMHQVVMNLITNAAEAIGDDAEGEIRLSTGFASFSADFLAKSYLSQITTPGEYLYLKVVDTGCGMDQHTLARIFEPFFTTKFQGRGLGLAATLGIVRSHLGAAVVESEPDEGTSFTIVYPAAMEAKLETVVDDQPTFDQVAGKTVLIVDDEERLRNVTRMIMENAGFKTLSAENGRLALQIYEQHKAAIDCIILDVYMPVMSGREVYDAIRAERDDLPVLLISGYNGDLLRNKLDVHNKTRFIPKPFTTETLLSNIQKLLG